MSGDSTGPSMSCDSLEERRMVQTSSSADTYISRNSCSRMYEASSHGNSTTKPSLGSTGGLTGVVSSTSEFPTQRPMWYRNGRCTPVSAEYQFTGDIDVPLLSQSGDIPVRKEVIRSEHKPAYLTLGMFHHSTPDNIKTCSRRTLETTCCSYAAESLCDDVLNLSSSLDSSDSMCLSEDCSGTGLDVMDGNLFDSLGRMTVSNMDHVQTELHRLNLDIDEIAQEVNALGLHEDPHKYITLGTSEAVQGSLEVQDGENLDKIESERLHCDDKNSGLHAVPLNADGHASAAGFVNELQSSDFYIDDEYSQFGAECSEEVIMNWYNSIQVKRLSDWSFDQSVHPCESVFKDSPQLQQRFVKHLISGRRCTSNEEDKEFPEEDQFNEIGCDWIMDVDGKEKFGSHCLRNERNPLTVRRHTVGSIHRNGQHPLTDPHLYHNGYPFSGNEFGEDFEKPSSIMTMRNWKVKNLGDRISIYDYIRLELDQRCPAGTGSIVKEGYYEIFRRSGLSCIRHVRGDNYCVLRASLYQALVSNVLCKRTIGSFSDFTKKLSIFSDSNYAYLHQWNFANRLPFVQGMEVQMLVECFRILCHVVDVMSSLEGRVTRDNFLASLLNHRPDIDLRLLEAVKLLMMLEAIRFHNDMESRNCSVPTFAWLMFASINIKDLFLHHINPLGDSAAAQKLEMQLLGHALGIRIQIIRPSRFGTIDFASFYPDENELPTVFVIHELEQCYNVLTA